MPRRATQPPPASSSNRLRYKPLTSAFSRCPTAPKLFSPGAEFNSASSATSGTSRSSKVKDARHQPDRGTHQQSARPKPDNVTNASLPQDLSPLAAGATGPS